MVGPVAWFGALALGHGLLGGFRQLQAAAQGLVQAEAGPMEGGLHPAVAHAALLGSGQLQAQQVLRQP